VGSYRQGRGRAAGFTLIELMIVVAIVGILSSVAIPSFGKFTLRAKAAERGVLMKRIKQGVDDLYLRKGKVHDSGELEGDYQPAFPPTSTKQLPNWYATGWPEIFVAGIEIEGKTYYSYYFKADDLAAGGPSLVVMAAGDLDGDANYSYKINTYVRDAGSYRLDSEDPHAGAEDDLSAYGTF
jgi:prepilin-type N-terminal cleavage/methylation domain-containing protein